MAILFYVEKLDVENIMLDPALCPPSAVLEELVRPRSAKCHHESEWRTMESSYCGR